MGAPGAGMKAADQPAAESLLTAFKTLSAAERRRHASVLNYWMSVRGDKEFPPLHDLDPLELSDAGPNSILMELISGGHDAEIRHLGEALRDEAWPERIIDAPNPSVLSCIAKKLPIVAISRDFLAFEDEYETAGNKTHCSITLLPLSAGGAWVDYVYALVSTQNAGAKTAASAPKKAKESVPDAEPVTAEPEASADAEQEGSEDTVDLSIGDEVPEIAPEPESEPEVELAAELEAVDESTESTDPLDEHEAVDEPQPEPVPAAFAKAAPGFSKLLDSIAGLTGFYGSQPVKVEPVVEPEPNIGAELTKETSHDEVQAQEAVAAEVEEEPLAEPAEFEATEELHEEEEASAEEVRVDREPVAQEFAGEPAFVEEAAPARAKQTASVASEGSLQNKLTQVRTKADEARMARLKANSALYDGLGAAYDFALDAEEAPEEYLRLVEAQGLKIQLRSPMKPVVKLAFAGMCDEATIKQLEAVLAWAFDEELPRGSLAERIEQAGGIGAVLGSQAKAA